ncbi:MAG: signal peptidase II [Thermodesulfovibrionales bacterium]|nr:signal peptidase II [Thermodesulfovibrionales bacterium]
MKRGLLPYIILALFTFLIDQLTKFVVKSHIGPFDTLKILPFFNIVYVENTGSAFGMLKSVGSLFFIAISVIVIIVVSLSLLKEKDSRLGYSLILGGAVGNLSDRVLYGYVIDFLEFHLAGYYWPIFNVADTALTIGIFLLLYKTYLNYKQRGDQKRN